MKTIRFFLFIICSVFVTEGLAQDLIIKKDGNKIYCQIVSEDSIAVYYIRPGQKAQLEIKKSEIEKFFVSRNSAGKTMAASSIKVMPEQNEILIFSFFGGLANPLGDFGSKDLNNEAAGLANMGSVFHAAVMLKLTKNFGFSAAYRYQAHSFDHEVINTQLTATYRGTSFMTNSTNWIIKGFFGGLFFTFPVKTIPNLCIDLDVSGGLPTCVLPELVTTGTTNGSVITFDQHSSEVKVPAFLGGMGLHYKVNKQVALNFNVSYLEAKASFANILSTGSNGYVSYGGYTQKIKTLNILGGLSFLIYPQ